MHITLSQNVASANIAPVELELVHTSSFLAIDVQSPSGVTSSVVITQDSLGQLEALIYAGNPQDVIPHREPLRSSIDEFSLTQAAASINPIGARDQP